MLFVIGVSIVGFNCFLVGMPTSWQCLGEILGAFGGVRESLGRLLGLFWLSGGRNLQPNWGQQDGASDNLELEISSVART